MTDARWTEAVHGEPSDVVRAVGLVVDYGRRAALRDVTLRLPAGELFGVLGPNGAGKSTLFRVLATLLAPTRGDVRICGLRVTDQRREIRAAIAHMPDLAPMPSDLRAGEYLRFFAECHGLRGAARDARVTECLDSVDLRDRAEDICTRLSLGMRQRLAVAKAMLHRPRLLILDEPASGLDAVARVVLRAALRRQVDEGATVILSSHVPSEIQELCTSVGLLRAGRLLDAGPLASVLSRQAGGDGGKHGARFVATAPGAAARVAGWLRGQPHVQLVADAPAGDEIAFSLDTSGTTAAQLFTALGAAGLGVSGLRAVPPSVEDMVIHLSQTTATHE